MTRRCPFCDTKIVLRRSSHDLLVFNVHTKFVRGQGFIRCVGSNKQAEDKESAAHS